MKLVIKGNKKLKITKNSLEQVFNLIFIPKENNSIMTFEK